MRAFLRVALVLLCVVGLGATVGVASALASVSRFGGGEGTRAGQFHNPRGVAVEQESGDVYVVDRSNARIEKFGPEGEFLLAWGWGVADKHSEALQTCTSLCFAGIEGAGSGQFNLPEGVAVDNDPLSPSYHDVYVVDSRNLRVEKFSPSGSFLLTFGGAVNATTSGNVCLAGEACQAGTAGSGAGEFAVNEGDRIAVDSTGTVFVGDQNRVQKFSSGGVYEGEIALPGVGRIVALAVDSSSDVYVEGTELAGVHKYNAAGVELGEPRDPSIQPFFGEALAVGPFDELFVDNTEGDSHHLLEFDPAGAEVARFDGGSEAGYSGIAFSDSIGGLYVLELGGVRLVFPPPAGPLLAAGGESAAELQPTTATVDAVLNPEGHETSYRFEYGTSTAYGTSTPTATLAAGFEDQPVSVGLSGLQPRTTYHFRIVASSSAGTTFGPDESFVTLPPALIDSESASQVTSNSATLAAQINPLGSDTKYRFEYGSTTAYGTSLPVPDGDVGSGTADAAVSASIEGLSPGATYHYRVVASNVLGAVQGTDRAFRTQTPQAPGLLDGRAWEMVSPPDKHGETLETLSSFAGGLIQAAKDGGAISYLASGPITANPPANQSFQYTQLLATRTPGGWATQDITTPRERQVIPGIIRGEYLLFSEDLAAGLVEPRFGATPLSSAASELTPYLREANGEFTPLVNPSNVPAGTKFDGNGDIAELVTPVGASPDLSHVVVRSEFALTPGVTGEGVYEWSAGSLQLVSVMPDGKSAVEDDQGNSALADRDAVLADGSRVAWITNGHLYVRDMRLGQTVQLDTVEAGAQGGAGTPVFQAASGDGSKIFFTDETQLTSDATSRRAEPDLYMCEVHQTSGHLSCALKDLTVDDNAEESADVRGYVFGAGNDGRYVYFVAGGALASGAKPGNCGAHLCNLYVEDTVAGERRFIAALSSEDSSDWADSTIEQNIQRTVRSSPNGRYLAFMSLRSLTGYDNIDASSGQPDTEVFLYDASSGELICASCSPSGARPRGVFDTELYPGLMVDRIGASKWGGHWLAGSIPGPEIQSFGFKNLWYQPHFLADSGRLLFNSADDLVPRDTNRLEDVYEYEPGGVAGCADVSGCIGLISSGTSSEESALLDTSASGDDVFFLTASRLAPQDVDSSLDVYDARVCTNASPCVAPAAIVSTPAPCASSDVCRGIGSSQGGAFVAPASTTVAGAGNVASLPAAKPVARAKRVSRAQRLANALRACRRKHGHRSRVLCEARARRLYRKGAAAKHKAARAGAMSKGNR